MYYNYVFVEHPEGSPIQPIVSCGSRVVTEITDDDRLLQVYYAIIQLPEDAQPWLLRGYFYTGDGVGLVPLPPGGWSDYMDSFVKPVITSP